MSTNFTPERIQRELAICAAASEGPWTVMPEEGYWSAGLNSPDGIAVLWTSEQDEEGMQNTNDVEFCATARTSFPEALQEIVRLQAALTAVIERSNNREMGTGKVPDMRNIATEALFPSFVMQEA